MPSSRRTELPAPSAPDEISRRDCMCTVGMRQRHEDIGGAVALADMRPSRPEIDQGMVAQSIPHQILQEILGKVHGAGRTDRLDGSDILCGKVQYGHFAERGPPANVVQ